MGRAWYQAEPTENANPTDQTVFVHARSVPYHSDGESADAPKQEIIHQDAEKIENVCKPVPIWADELHPNQYVLSKLVWISIPL